MEPWTRALPVILLWTACAEDLSGGWYATCALSGQDDDTLTLEPSLSIQGMERGALHGRAEVEGHDYDYELSGTLEGDQIDLEAAGVIETDRSRSEAHLTFDGVVIDGDPRTMDGTLSHWTEVMVDGQVGSTASYAGPCAFEQWR